MASLEEILQLDKTSASVRKIDAFLNSQEKYSKAYMEAVSFKGEIYYELGKINEALKLLYDLIPEISQMENESVITLLSTIINITLDAGIYDQASKYIRLKQKYLPVSRSSEYMKDLTRLHLSKGDLNEAKDALNSYLLDDISYDEEIYALEHLSSIYFSEKNYDKYLSCLPKLENHYSQILDITHLSEIAKNRIEIAYLRKSYVEVIRDGQKFLREYDTHDDNQLYVASYMMKSYIAVSDMKQASIVESNYEEYATEEHLDASLAFCNAAIELYNRTNTANSVLEYHARIDALEKRKKEDALPKEEPKGKARQKKKEIIIPEVIGAEVYVAPKPILEDSTYNPIGILNPKEEEVEVKTQKVIEDVKTVKNIDVSENFNKLTDVFNTLSSLEAHTKFREALRRCGIEICRQYPIDEIYILYFNGTYKGYHYKVERVYDKTPSLELLSDTLGFEAMKTDSEMFLDDSDDTYKKNIVTGEDYKEMTYALAMPLHDSISASGSVTYISHLPFLGEDLCYESLKLITSVLNARILECIDMEKNKEDNKKMIFIQENMSSGIKENREGFYHFSKVAQDMLGVLDTLTEEDYLLHLNAQDVAKYKASINELYTLNTMDLALEYDFDKNGEKLHIRERFYPMMDDGMIAVYSILDDLTAREKEKNDLVDLAYTNPISGMETIVKLTADLSLEYPKKKMSLAVLDVIDSDFYKEIYGLNFYNQVIRAVGMKLADAASSNFTFEFYHLGGTTYALLFRNINDKRVIDSFLKDILKDASDMLYEMNYRVKIRFNAGVYRLQKGSTLHDVQDMITYAQDALLDAKDMDTNPPHIAHYDSVLSQKRFRDNSIVTSISEAIDHNDISVFYKQIIDLEKSEVLGFTLSLSMDNYEIEEEEMMRVVRRKAMVPQMEKYIFSTAIKELKMFYGEIRSYLNLFIPVSRETVEERFPEFLIQQTQYYKVNPEYITVIADSINGTFLESLKANGFHLASHDIFDVYRNLCDYLIYDYHGVNKESIPEILDLCSKHNVICILSHMDDEEDVALARESGYRFIYGNYYKNRKRMKDILASLKKALKK